MTKAMVFACWIIGCVVLAPTMFKAWEDRRMGVWEATVGVALWPIAASAEAAERLKVRIESKNNH